MNKVIIGVITGVVIILVLGVAAWLGLFIPGRPPDGGGARPTATPSPIIPPSPTPSPTSPAANVKYELAVANITGSGLSRTITARLTNSGGADGHNVWVKLEAFSQGSRVRLSGQDFLRVDIGTLKAGTTLTRQLDLSLSIPDGVRVATNGAQFVLTIHSDERTETLNYDYRP